MPNISVTLTETSQSISRPVVFDIINQIQEITKISKDTKISYPGDVNKLLTYGSSIDSSSDKTAVFNTGRFNYIEVEEDYDLGAINTTAVSRKEHPPVFLDKSLQIAISPVYSTTNVVINFKYNCPSKSEVLRWRDDMRMRVSQYRDINLHQINYHYLLPYEFLAILKVIHSNREDYLGYGQSLEEYIKSYMSNKLTLIGSLIQDDGRLGIAEKQTRIIGMYDFEGAPNKPERDEANGIWTISFSYKFSYEKPIACNMRYPVIVHNKLLPQGYVEIINNYDEIKESSSASVSIAAMNKFESDTTLARSFTIDPILRVPGFDDFNISTVPTDTSTVFIALSEVDKTDSKSLINLNELGDIMLDQDILEFIKQVEYPYITSLYQSVFHLSLYRNEYLAREDSLSCDAELNVKAVNELNLRNQHRVRLSLVTNLALIKDSAIDRLRTNPKVFVKVIGCISELIRNHPDLQNMVNQEMITSLQYKIIYSIITGYYHDGRRGSGSQYLTGNQANNWPYFSNNSGLFKDINPNILEQYRRNRRNLNTVQTTGVVAMKLNQ